MNKFTFGIDVSHWQTNSAQSPQYFFDPFIAKDKGVQFAFIRASDGTRKDNAFDHFAREFNRAGIPWAPYHFLRPQSQYSYISQVDKFIEYISPYKFQLRPVLDVEADGLGLDLVRQWCGRLETKLGAKPIIYTAPNPWNTYRGVADAAWALEYDYWVANYFSGLKWPVYDIPEIVLHSTSMPTQLQPWAKAGKPWKFWQFCAVGDGEFYGGNYAKHTDQTGLDMNVFNGTTEQFNAYFGLSEQPQGPEEPDEPEPLGQVRVIARQANGQPGWLFFRDAPEIYDGEVLAVGYGNIFTLLEPDPVNGFWHVESARGREGYISAHRDYTQLA